MKSGEEPTHRLDLSGLAGTASTAPAALIEAVQAWLLASPPTAASVLAVHATSSGLFIAVAPRGGATATVLLIVDTDSVVGGRLGTNLEIGFLRGRGSVDDNGRLALDRFATLQLD